MRVTIQRVNYASVNIKQKEISRISEGLAVFVAVCNQDTQEDILWLSKKICFLRVFSDNQGKMNFSLLESGGDILLISQFTLYAKTKKGNRPSFLNSASQEFAESIYNSFKLALEECLAKKVYAGQFGEDMEVLICNNGPITINIDSKIRE
tara:strand:+ start:958 stop:1410 length:453 start_codon:yes stop_codon:yes gene_type:complete